ncbi:MAG: hypothetical protein ABR992_13600 [Solirubrobacteraceae bacterium]|jgi:hypothetical protein
MSRVAITLDEHALAELGRRAQSNGEPVSRTAARLVRDGLLSTQAQAGGEPAPAIATRLAEGQDAGLPGWLEPPDKREQWRRELWAAVCALAERYPGVFSKLVADWWTDRALVEVLGALSAWRSQLDAGQSADPRAELLFHDRLELLERQLTHASDPTAARFAGGPPPSEWVAK